ncbi:MAG: response regulator [Alphaproteobacteria bacterium]|uniref:Response regulator n=1 Tax=Candidatus Nitrobium versatile TaxID=2884831 RepID=A0A953M0W3_9BACT|nr:response regulator [Candidatus Nitrobium versatile]
MTEEIRILCVDDEPNVLNSLRRLFLDDDYTILTAASGQEGLGLLEREPVHLVISDYRMPGMNGVEFLKEVCREWPDTVRIVLSGYADTASIVSAINEGQIYKFIPKPWNDDELKVTVSNALERYFLYRKNRELTFELAQKNDKLVKLLQEKSASLEFRSRVLIAHQKIFDSLPVGIMGVDFENVLVLCNSAWREIAGAEWCLLGQSINGVMPDEIVALIEGVKRDSKAIMRFEIRGVRGIFMGSLLQDDVQKGVTLLFIREDDLW